MRYIDIVNAGKEKLRTALIEDADNDAFLLFEYVFGMNRTKYFMEQMQKCDDLELIDKYNELISIREKRIPLQHITGSQEFMGFDFKVSENTLIPRQETEILVEKAIELSGKCGNEVRILDMCTGTGCIAISISKYVKKSSILAADISKEALLIVGENIDKLDATNVSLIESNMFENVNGTFDMIVSNPPYIKTAEIEKLEEEVKLHDPFIALDGKEDGLYFYRIITKEATKHLNNGGYLLFEIGHDQADDVSMLLFENGFTDITVLKDYGQLDRVVYGRLDLPFL